MGEFASKGIAGTGLGLGIAGTALGLLNGNNCGNGCGTGGILGNLFGGNCGCNNQGNAAQGAHAVNVMDAKYESRENALLRERIAKLEAEKYSDSVGIGAYKEAIALSNKNDDRFRESYKELAQEAADNRVRQARMEEQIKCLSGSTDMRFNNTNAMFAMQINNVNERIENAQKECMGEIKCLATNTRERLEALRAETREAIALESERRACGDDKLYCYVNGTFVPGKLVMPLASICPPAQPATTTTAAA